MTLNELALRFYAMPSLPGPSRLYIFRNEESADNWILDKYFGEDHRDYELLAVHQSDCRPELTLKDKWCKSEVMHFFAVEPDVLVVVLEEVS